MTCNPKWLDIEDACTIQYEGKNIKKDYCFRPDIISRCFQFRIKHLIKLLMKDQIFGKALAYVATIEFQKRGLPHLHLLLILSKKDKQRLIDNVDDFISAEIPDKDEDPILYNLVKENMMHGPCGEDDPNCYCMIDGKCRFGFPKK